MTDAAQTGAPDLTVYQKEFVQLGNEIQKLATSRQQLVIQLNENEGVLAEIALMSKEAELFRSVGSALIRMETPDVKALVDSRVDMIKKELAKIEQMVQEKGKRRLEIQSEVQAIQQKVQQQAQAGASKAPTAVKSN